MHADIHLVLVSDQATPNLTPVLDPDLKPEAIVLLTSPDKQVQAEWLAEALKDSGVKISRLDIDNAWDMPAITERLLNWLGEHERQSIALNATGGTKLMSIAAYEAFRAAGKPIFYVHPEHDRLMWISPEGRPDQELADRIKLPAFLLAHGARIKSRGSRLGVPDHRRALTDEIIRHIERYAPHLRTLNRAAAEAKQSLASQVIAKAHRQDPDFDALVRNFEQAGLLREQAGRIIFADEDSRFYVNGGWLEDHVYGLCLNLKKETGIQDIARGLEIERHSKGGAVPNQIDVAFLANNRLHVIECKTRRFEDATDDDGKGANTLYKLDSLTDLLGGLKAKALLVSYQTLGHYDLQRARDLRIEVCHGPDLKALATRLRRWIQ